MPKEPEEKQPLSVNVANPVSLCPRPRALMQHPQPLPALTQCTESLPARFEDRDLSFSFEHSITSTHDHPITTPHVPITPTDTTPHVRPATFTPSSLTKMKRDSCSRANFATNLVRVRFTGKKAMSEAKVKAATPSNNSKDRGCHLSAVPVGDWGETNTVCASRP